MLPLPAKSPLDGGEIVVTRFFCPQSGVSVEGEFSVSMPFATLNRDQLQFVETFVRCEGRLNRMETELGISYPTIRTRLHEIIRALGYEPGKEEPAPTNEDERRRLLAELDSGRMNFDEVMGKLRATDGNR